MGESISTTGADAGVAMRRAPRGLRRPLHFRAPAQAVGRNEVLALIAASPFFLVLLAVPLALVFGLGSTGFWASLAGCVVAFLGWRHAIAHRGRLRIAIARARMLTRPEAGLAQLRRIARSSLVMPELRIDAAAEVALHALERGEVADAIRVLRLELPDEVRSDRRRAWPRGARGEVTRSILAWLVPDAFASEGIARSSQFPAPDRPDAVALATALRVLEAAGGEAQERVIRAWQDASAGELARLEPRLFALCEAAAAERIPELRPEHERRLGADPALRLYVERLRPPAEGRLDDAYRGAPGQAETALASSPAKLLAPTELATQAMQPPRGVDRLLRAHGGLGTFAAVVLSFLAWVGILSSGVAGAGLGALAVFWSGLVGVTLVVPVGARVAQSLEARHHAHAMFELAAPPPAAWRTEMVEGPPGPVARPSGFRRRASTPLPQLTLYVACVRGEQALADGQLEEAWAAVSWWFSGLDPRALEPDPMYATASSLVRLAVLTGHPEAAQRLLDGLDRTPRKAGWHRRRSAHGDAPRALALARAAHLARQDRPAEAARWLRLAQASPAVWIDPRDRSLYAWIARAVEREGHAVPSALTRGVRPEDLPWLDRLWPSGPVAF